MSTKPTTVATWSTTGPVTVPTSGKQAAGFVPGERGAAQYFNWILNTAGLWEQYLSDGDCTFHNLTVTGSLLFTTPYERPLPFDGSGTNVTVVPTGVSMTGSAWTYLTGPLPLRVGDRLTTMRAIVNANGASETLHIVSQKSADLATSWSDVYDSGALITAGAGVFDLATVIPSPATIATGERWRLKVTGPNAADLITQLNIKWDHPA